MAALTERQRSYIVSLLAERLVSLQASSLNDAIAQLHVDALTVNDARVIIDRLRAMPADPDPTMPPIVARATRHGVATRPGACSFCKGLVKPGQGFYYSDGVGGWLLHHRAGECFEKQTPLPEIGEGLYLIKGDPDQVVLVYKTKRDHLAGKILANGRFNYLGGLVMQVRAAFAEGRGRKVSAQDARDYGYLNQHCIACGLPLTDPRSDPLKGGAGYGPVCAKRHGWPWGGKS